MPPAPVVETPWSVGARALWGLWAAGALCMLKLSYTCQAFMGQGFWYGLPRVLWERAVWDRDATAVPLLGVIAPRVWETEIEELGCTSVSQHEAVALWGRLCYCGVRPGLGVS